MEGLGGDSAASGSVYAFNYPTHSFSFTGAGSQRHTLRMTLILRETANAVTSYHILAEIAKGPNHPADIIAS